MNPGRRSMTCPAADAKGRGVSKSAGSVRFVSVVPLALALLVLAFVGLPAGATADPAPPPDAETLLDALETADRDIETFTARLDYSKFFAIQSDEQRRIGRLYYRSSPPTDEADAVRDRRFAVAFSELIVGTRREQIDQHYAFDGEWVIEKTADDRQFTKRQIVPPGERFDPLKIGEGPFPVPIGQRKADILARFEAEVVGAEDDLTEPSLIEFAKAKGLVHLRLVPRAGSPQEGDFESVHVWYEPSGRMLPRIAKTVTPVGDESLVVLLEPTINEVIDEALFSTETPPAEEGWNVHISEYRRSEADVGGVD